MAAPVCGLRAVRALRCDVLNVPNPTKVMESPFLSDRVIPSINESTDAAALTFDAHVSFAIFAINSCLFMDAPADAPAERAGQRRARCNSRRELYGGSRTVSTGKRD